MTAAFRSSFQAMDSNSIATTADGVAEGTLSERNVRQLLERGLEPELASRLGWRSAPARGEDWIAIPYVKGGVVVNHKYRTLAGEKRFAQDTGAEKCFWNFDVLTDAALKDQPIIITEGETDALAALQAGYSRTVSVPDGAPAQAIGGALGPKYDYLEGAMPALRQASEIILATDGDGAGGNLFHDLLMRLGSARCKFVTYPKHRGKEIRCKDLNEALQEYGVKGVRQTIAQAEWVHLPGVYKMSQLPALPEMPVMDLGFGAPMDDCAKARRGDFWVLTGKPGHGKTSWITDALCRLAQTNNLRIAWASFENIPQQDLKRELRKWHVGSNRGRGEPWRPWTAAECEAADVWIDSHFRFLYPGDDEDPTPSWLFKLAEVAVVRHDCDVLVVDPYNELEHEIGSELSLTQYTGNFIKAMKRFAKRFQILAIVLAHPRIVRHGEDVTLYSISDSAHWNNKADIGIIISRDQETNDAEIIVAKCRYEGIIGKRGKITMRLNPETRRFNVPDEARS